MKVSYADIDCFLEPGGLYVGKRPAMVKTILGSCVGVCLYDRKARIGGINHYVMPRPGEGDPFDGHYGSCSMQMLVESMRRAGATLQALKAHVVGGARPIGGEHGPQIGLANRTVALEMLRLYRIPIINEQTGGELGRRVFFNTGTGRVIVQVIERNPRLWTRPSRRIGS